MENCHKSLSVMLIEITNYEKKEGNLYTKINKTQLK